jgi:hypothetical protein
MVKDALAALPHPLPLSIAWRGVKSRNEGAIFESNMPDVTEDV